MGVRLPLKSYLTMYSCFSTHKAHSVLGPAILFVNERQGDSSKNACWGTRSAVIGPHSYSNLSILYVSLPQTWDSFRIGCYYNSLGISSNVMSFTFEGHDVLLIWSFSLIKGFYCLPMSLISKQQQEIFFL